MEGNNFIARVDASYRRKTSEDRYKKEKRAEFSEALKKYQKELYNNYYLKGAFCEELIAGYNRKEIDITDLCNYICIVYNFYRGEE